MCSGFKNHNRHSEVVIEDRSLLLTPNPFPQTVTCQPPQFHSLQSSYNALVCGICMVPFPSVSLFVTWNMFCLHLNLLGLCDCWSIP